MDDFAAADNKLAKAQLAIGESSNLAQLCLTYSYNFQDIKYRDNVVILSVVAQAAIDNAKRTFDIDLTYEIRRLKADSNIVENGVPKFWEITKKDKRKAKNDEERRERIKENKDKVRAKVNKNLICPMNYIYDLQLDKFRNSSPTIPIGEFFINHEQHKNNIRKSKKVEEFIEKYSLQLYNFRVENDDNWEEDEGEILLLRSDFEDLINDINQIYISRNYQSLMAWLINRAFCIGSGVRSKKDIMETTLNKNKSILLKTLYDINKDAFLSCFKEKKCGTIDF